ncbi:MAG: GNAT family N-acetyltransferase [Actinobacteria bacterium]|nr:GNAT family N-acetyltransferase [Actinomycetota bacterium]
MPLEQLKRFRKVVKLKDGTLVVLRPLGEGDGQRLVDMFASIPETDRRLLKHDVTDATLIASWANHIRFEVVFPLVAQIDDEIVADATLHKNPGTSLRHVAEVRVAIGARARGRGLGRIMLEELVALADKVDIEQLRAEVPVGSAVAQRAFEKVGFKQEAVFKDYFKTADDQYHDVAVMFLVLRDRWEEF